MFYSKESQLEKGTRSPGSQEIVKVHLSVLNEISRNSRLLASLENKDLKEELLAKNEGALKTLGDFISFLGHLMTLNDVQDQRKRNSSPKIKENGQKCEKERPKIMNELEILESKVARMEKTIKEEETQKKKLQEELIKTKNTLAFSLKELETTKGQLEKEKKSKEKMACQNCLKAKSLFLEEQAKLLGYLNSKRTSQNELENLDISL